MTARQTLRNHLKRTLFLSALLAAVSSASAPVWAWKPTTHVHLAEEAMSDALNDGYVTIELVDFWGQTTNGVLGDFAVDPRVLDALRRHPEIFRAGVLGPDAYPDMMAGQTAIHPADNDANDPGSDGWLQMLEHNAVTPDEVAFVAGFLAHAAGDMYGHTIVNDYAGGPFELGDNAIRHVVVEGYINKRSPLPTFQMGLSPRTEDFVYRYLVDATRSAHSGSLWRRKAGRDEVEYSVPYLFSSLRDALTDWLVEYEQTVRFFDAQIAAGNIFEKAYWESVKLGYIVSRAPKKGYWEAWIEDIDRGLRHWPAASTQVAAAAMFNPAGDFDFNTIDRVLSDYMWQYGASMAGAPDWAVDVAQFLDLNIPSIWKLIGLDQVIEQLKRQILDYVLVRTFGKTRAEIESYFTDPETWVDAWGYRQSIDDAMGVADPVTPFDWRDFAAARNSVTMIKLSLLGAGARANVMRALGFPVSGPIANAMLGFMKSLDLSVQWNVNREQMLLHWDCFLYQNVFMNQIGDQTDVDVLNQSYMFGPEGSKRACPDVRRVWFSGGCGETQAHVQLDSPAHEHGAVVWLDWNWPAGLSGAPQSAAYVLPGDTVANHYESFGALAQSYTIGLTADRESSASATTTVGPPGVTNMSVNVRSTGNPLSWQQDRVLAGDGLYGAVRLGCNATVVPGSPVTVSACPGTSTAPSGPGCVQQTFAAATNRYDYSYDLTMPAGAQTSAYILRAQYLSSAMARNFTLVANRLRRLEVNPQSVAVASLGTAQVAVTVELASPAGLGGETVYFVYQGAGVTGPASVAIPRGATRPAVAVTVTVSGGGVTQSMSYNAVIGARSALDPQGQYRLVQLPVQVNASPQGWRPPRY
ncbi:MAG: hypothetical protein HYV63_14080 [Candidatus Schekmanbacteria bacterium]|nr:hypothetical protein [Candidatus Schekmanbacteria bacterium]